MAWSGSAITSVASPTMKLRITYTYHELRQMPVEAQRQRGVSQGGALSLLIANIVLNDVDQPIVSTPDPCRLFIRYCDDMILLHTNQEKCQALKSNIDSLKERFNRQEIIHHRHEKDHTRPEAEELTRKAIKRILDSPTVYTAFDQEGFKRGSQYKYLLQLKSKCEKRLKL